MLLFQWSNQVKRTHYQAITKFVTPRGLEPLTF